MTVAATILTTAARRIVNKSSILNTAVLAQQYGLQLTIAKRSLSSSVKEATSVPHNNNEDTSSTTPQPYLMYSWGTSNKGNIPVTEALEKGRTGEASGSSLLGRSGSIIDHPQKIDVKDAFKTVDDKTVTVKSVNCGPTGTAVILSDNTCYTFGGENKSGQLGHGNTDEVAIPTLLSPPDSTPLHHNEISQIELGANFSAIIDTKGDLYTFGHNGSAIRKEGAGCLGHGYFPEEYKYSPTLVQSLVEDGCYASQVAVGNLHMTVLTTEGEVLTCGAGAYGRLGNLDTIDQLYLEPVEMLAGETDIVQITGGKDYSLALNGRDGIIFAWGRNHKGQCGTGSGMAVDVYAMEPMPMPIEGLLEGRNVVKIAAGAEHAAAITDKGELFTWGMGQAFVPVQQTSLGFTKVVDVACGQDYTIAVTEDGSLYSVGKGKTGVLGLASEKSAAEPTLLEGLKGQKVVQVSAGWTHVACLVEDNSDQE